MDRDGVINKKAKEHEYIMSRNGFFRNSKIKKFIKYCNDHDAKVVIISNQQWIGKGIFSVDDLHIIHQHMCDDLSKIWAKVDWFYFCPHLVSDNCDCRKPKPWMLQQACNDLHISDKKEMIFIGDSQSDIECADNFWIDAFRIETDRFEDYFDQIIPLITS